MVWTIVEIYKCILKLVLRALLILFVIFILLVLLVIWNNSRRIPLPKKARVYNLDWTFNTSIKVESELESFETRNNETGFYLPRIPLYGSEYYHFPLLVDMVELVERIKSGQKLTVKPINDPKFPYLINRNICEKRQESIDLLIVIRSSPINSLARDAIRATWGKLNCWGDRIVKKVFLIGNIPSVRPSLKHQIEMENIVFKDIIQSDFDEHIFNNTYKMMVGISWAIEFCNNAQYIMLVDDDYFVQPQIVLTYLNCLSKSLVSRLIAGYVIQNSYIATIENGVRSQSPDDYPWSAYPPYISAGNILMSMSVARDIHIAMKYTRFLHYDDVFLGIVLYKLLLTPIHISSVYSTVPISSKATEYRYMMSSHGYKCPQKIFQSWIELGCASFCSSREI